MTFRSGQAAARAECESENTTATRTIDQLIPRSVEAIAKMSRATAVKLVVVTNQGGVGEGKLTDETARAILDRLAQRVTEAGGHLVSLPVPEDRPRVVLLPRSRWQRPR